MGDAKRRGTREDRVAAARERERADWAEEMVADAAAIEAAAWRRVQRENDVRVASGTLVAWTPQERADRAAMLCALAVQRAVASSAFDEPEDDEDDEDEEREW